MVSRMRGDVRVLAAASAASNTGNWAASVALALVVFAKTGSTVWLSASFLFTQVPSALAAPLSGMMADRLDRKRIMITCDLLGAAVYLGMAVTGQPLLLIVLGSVAALLHAPFGPAARAAVPNLAGEAGPGVGQRHAGGRVERRPAGWPGGRWGALRDGGRGACVRGQRGVVRHLRHPDRGSPRAVPRAASRGQRLRCAQQQHLGGGALPVAPHHADGTHRDRSGYFHGDRDRRRR